MKPFEYAPGCGCRVVASMYDKVSRLLVTLPPKCDIHSGATAASVDAFLTLEMDALEAFEAFKKENPE